MHQRRVSSPSVSAALQWLAAHPPPDGARLCLLHGDYGLHHMLFQQDRITALLDWEHASLGDPARDLVQIRRQLTQFVAWRRFMRWYREAGGPNVPVGELELLRGVFSRQRGDHHAGRARIPVRAAVSRADQVPGAGLELPAPLCPPVHGRGGARLELTPRRRPSADTIDLKRLLNSPLCDGCER
jgi:hypothetical protein